MTVMSQPASRTSIAVAAIGAVILMGDGALRLLLADQRWLFQMMGSDIIPAATVLFVAMGWPIDRIMLLVPFMGAWEIAVGMFLCGALYEQATHDTDDLVPGSAMLILGVAMALTTLCLVLGIALLAGQGGRIGPVLALPLLACCAALMAAIAERMAADALPPLEPGPAVAIVLVRR